MHEITLTDGTLVRARSVPPYATMQVRQVEKPPAFPREKIKSAAGGVEEQDALENSDAAKEWTAQMQDFQQRQRERTENFLLDFGIVEWKRPDQEWTTDPPDEWSIPSVLVRHGIIPSDNRRVDFIKYELIATGPDQDKLDSVLTGEYEPITQEEVDQALVPFD